MFSFIRKIFSGSNTPQQIPLSVYDFKVPSLTGGIIDFNDFRGKKILVVNTASRCGFTPQFQQLEALYTQHKATLVVVGFPSNNFLFQDPGSNEEIAGFCSRNYGVSFPMAEKVSVRGLGKAPLYTWLTQKKFNKLKDSRVKWNFQKYLIDENGRLTHIFAPSTSPDAAEISDAIRC